MATEQVIYEMSLKDLLSSKIDDASKSVDHLEGNLGNLKETLLHVGEAIGIAFGIERIIEFGKEVKNVTQEFEGFENRIKFSSTSADDATKNLEYLNDAVSRLKLPMKETYEGFSEMQAGLIGTGIEGDKLRNLFEGLSTASTVLHLNTQSLQRTLYDFKEIGEIGLNGRIERSLSTAFPGINEISKEVFGGTLKQVQEAGISGSEFLAKIGEGLQKHFSEGLPNALQSLQAKTNEMDSEIVRMQLDLGTKLKPVFIGIMNAIIHVVDGIKVVVDWVAKHSEVLSALAIGVGVAAGAYLGYIGVMAVLNTTTTLVTAAQWLLNVALTANPVGIVIAAIALFVAGLVQAYRHSETFRAVLWGLWATIKEAASLIVDAFQNVWHVLHGVFTFNGSEIKQGIVGQVDLMLEAGQRIGAAFKKGYDGGIADFAKDHLPEQKSLLPKKEGNLKTVAALPTVEPGGKSKATGQKIVNIRIDIKNLVNELKIQTTNLHDSAGKIKDAVTQALVSAVNDSQIVGGQ